MALLQCQREGCAQRGIFMRRVGAAFHKVAEQLFRWLRTQSNDAEHTRVFRWRHVHVIHQPLDHVHVPSQGGGT